MNKNTIAISLLTALSAGSLGAQSLYDLAPDDSTTESLPLAFTAGFNLGYDNNPTPLFGGDESFYGQAYVGATFLHNSPQTTFNFGAQIGVIHYFDNLDVPGRNVDDTTFTISLYANWTRRVSERLRFVSRNNLAYELEPDFSTGFQAQRQVGNYFRYSTDNAVGYRWSERLATYTGVRFNGISFDDFPAGDRSLVTIYNDFRYQVSERTVATLTYRYQDVDGEGSVPDATNHFILVGLEHRFSPRSTAVVRAGAQIREVDFGTDGNSPYLEATLRTQVNERFSLRTYARYGVEDWQRVLQLPFPGPTVLYSNTDTLRLGVTGNYALSRAINLTGGVNLAFLDFNDPQGPAPVGLNSVSEELVNVFVGFDYAVDDSLSVNFRYNFEDLSSDAVGRNYDRNRISIGASKTF